MLAGRQDMDRHCFDRAQLVSRDWLVPLEIALIYLHYAAPSKALQRAQAAAQAAANAYFAWYVLGRCQEELGFIDSCATASSDVWSFVLDMKKLACGWPNLAAALGKLRYAVGWVGVSSIIGQNRNMSWTLEKILKRLGSTMPATCIWFAVCARLARSWRNSPHWRATNDRGGLEFALQHVA